MYRPPSKCGTGEQSNFVLCDELQVLCNFEPTIFLMYIMHKDPIIFPQTTNEGGLFFPSL